MASRSKMRYDIEKLNAARDVIRAFNSLDLAAVELYENGKPISVSPELRDEWRFIGLTNACFVECRFWEQGE